MRNASTRKKTVSSIQVSIGQLIIIGFDGTEMSPRLASLLTRLQPAGVILFARNIRSGEQTYKLLKNCQACVSTPLFTCVDMEGGRVDRFRNVTGSSPSAADVFATGDRKLFRKHGEVIGESCRALGFNTDFAPVVDLAFEASKAVMSSRAGAKSVLNPKARQDSPMTSPCLRNSLRSSVAKTSAADGAEPTTLRNRSTR